MTQLTIVTTPQNSGDGTPLATAFNYCNSNFSELYARVQTNPPATLVGAVGDQAGMYAYDPSYFYYCFANYNGTSAIWAQVTQVGNIAVSTISDGTSNVKITGVNGDATINISGISNIAAFRATGAYITGQVSASGNITGSNISGSNVAGTKIVGGDITAVGNVLANNIAVTGYLTTGTGLLAANAYPGPFTDGIVVDYVTGNGRISVGGSDSISFYNNGVGNVAIVSFDPQGNIDTAGSFNSTGNILTQGIVSAIGNIVTDGYFVGTFVGNVTGNFVIPGSNTQVVFNTAGNADAVGGFTYNKDSNTMIVLGIISSQGNVVGGNIRTAGQVSATGTITGGNLNTGGTASITGTITGGNLNTGGTASITGNVTSGNILTGGLVSATGNVTGGNILTGGNISATGNIKAGNISITDVEAGGNISSTNYTGSAVSVTGNVTGSNVLTGGVVSATGNITGSYILGNGRQLTGLAANNIIQYGNSNVLVGSTGNVSFNILGVTNIVSVTSLGQAVTGELSVTGTISSGNITTGGLISATGNITGGNINAASYTGSNISVTGNVVGSDISGTNLSVSGTVTSASVVGGVLSGASLTVTTGSVTLGSIINGNANSVGNIGSAGNNFNTVFALATSAQYADLAECYLADADYAPGTVLSFGGEAEVTISNIDADALIVGVVSTNPAHLMNSGLTGKHIAVVALAGRVPCQVEGPVSRGAMMVSAGTGRARAEANPIMGTVIGKAVESFTGDIGTIEIVVGRL